MAGFGAQPRRYLCSQLVTLKWRGGSRVVNLEEICRTAATLESDTAIPTGLPAEMYAEEARFHGTVTEVEAHELGWRIEFEFSPLTPWSPESFHLEHLLDPASME